MKIVLLLIQLVLVTQIAYTQPISDTTKKTLVNSPHRDSVNHNIDNNIFNSLKANATIADSLYNSLQEQRRLFNILNKNCDSTNSANMDIIKIDDKLQDECVEEISDLNQIIDHKNVALGTLILTFIAYIIYNSIH
jgi:DNA gyrase/topoisomerase IV subunit B